MTRVLAVSGLLTVLAGCSAAAPRAERLPGPAAGAREARREVSQSAQARTRAAEEGDRPVESVRPALIRMELHDADVRTALLAIAAQAGVSIVIPEEVQGRVTLSLVDVAWMDALEAVASCSGHVLVRGRKHE